MPPWLPLVKVSVEPAEPRSQCETAGSFLACHAVWRTCEVHLKSRWASVAEEHQVRRAAGDVV